MPKPGRGFVTAAVVLAVVMAGCGGDDESVATDAFDAFMDPTAPTSTMDDAEGIEPDAHMHEDEASEHDAEDDDLIGGPADPAAAARVVDIEMSEMAFTPDTVAVEPGEIVRFRVTNVGTVEHEMTIGDPATHEELAAEMAAGDHDHDHMVGGGVVVQPGDTEEFSWQFPMGDAMQHLSFACHVPGHWEAGMEGAFS